MSCTHLANCSSCGGETRTLFDFGQVPLVNDFRGLQAPKFPLHLMFCQACGLGQLSHEVDAELLFPKSYPYRSGSTGILRKNFEELASEIRALGASVLEIGCNDGTLLGHLKDLRHLGVDPSDAVLEAKENGITVEQGYFGPGFQGGQFQVVTCSNAFAHIPDPNGITKAVRDALLPDGTFIVEVHYLGSVIGPGLQWDTCYHEHLRYYSLHSLSELLLRNGLTPYDAKMIPTHGGSIRVYASNVKRETTQGFHHILNQERQWDLASFPVRVAKSIQELRAFLGGASPGVAFGAPSRGVTLLNVVGHQDKILEVYEPKGSPKLRKQFPGTAAWVRQEDYVLRDAPFGLLLSHHIGETVMASAREKGFTGKFVKPLPEMETF